MQDPTTDPLHHPDPLRWLLLGLAALALLCYPWLAPFTDGRWLAGIPLILVYLFGAWAALIAVAASWPPRA